MIVASIMTGTSVDGVDISIVDVNSKKLLHFYSFDLLWDEKHYIEKFIWPSNSTLDKLSEFNFKFSSIVAKYFNQIPSEVLSSVSIVVYHGQTVFHDSMKKFSGFQNTMQLGNGAVLSQMIKKDVLCDLRSSDVAVGQNGAPIVGFGDKEFFWKNDNVAIFNIGGISNVTYISEDGEITSFDLGVGNALLDTYVKKYFNLPFDKDGQIAASGKISHELLNKLNSDPYLLVKPPKSTGKEVYNIQMLEELISSLSSKPSHEDIMCTISHNLVETLLSIGNFVDVSKTKFYLAGGGIRNKFVYSLLQNRLDINSTEVLGIDPQARESASFAFFAKYYLENKKIGTGPIKTIFGCLYKF